MDHKRGRRRPACFGSTIKQALPCWSFKFFNCHCRVVYKSQTGGGIVWECGVRCWSQHEGQFWQDGWLTGWLTDWLALRAGVWVTFLFSFHTHMSPFFTHVYLFENAFAYNIYIHMCIYIHICLCMCPYMCMWTCTYVYVVYCYVYMYECICSVFILLKPI